MRRQCAHYDATVIHSWHRSLSWLQRWKICFPLHWKSSVIKMSSRSFFFSSPAALENVIMITYGATSDDKVSTVPSLSFHLTHWCWRTHMFVSKLTIIGSDNGLSPRKRQPIIWTNAGILLIGRLAANFNEIVIEIHALSFTKIH